MASLSDIFVRLLLDTETLKTQLTGARADFQKFFDSIKSGIEALGIATSAGGLLALTKQAIDSGVELGKMATRLNTTTDAIQELQHVATATGASLGDLESGLNHLNRLLGEAANDSQQAREVFSRLGVSWQDNTGRTRDAADALGDFADALKLKDAAAQSDLFFRAFGRGAQDMKLILALGGDEIKKFRAEAHSLGLVLDPEMLAALKKTHDAFDELTTKLRIDFQRGVVEATPSINAFIQALETARDRAGQLLDALRKADTAIRGSGLRALGFKEQPVFGAGPEPPPLEKFGPPSPPAAVTQELSSAQQIAKAAADAQKASDALRLGLARAQAAAPGGPEGAVASIEAEIAASAKLLDVQLRMYSAQKAATLTDAGKAELDQKAAHARVEQLITETGLRKQLTDAGLAASTEQAESDAQAVRAQQELNDSYDIGQKNIEEMREADRQLFEQTIKNNKALMDVLQAGGAAEPEGGPGPAPKAMTDQLAAVTSGDKAYGDYLRTITYVANAQKNLGFTFDSTSAEIAATEKALSDLAAQQITTGDRVDELKSKLMQLSIVRGVLDDVFGGVKTAVSGAIQGILQGTQTVSQAFQNMGRNIAAGLIDSAVKRGLNLLQSALEDFLKSEAFKSLLKTLAGLGLKVLGAFGAGPGTFAPGTGEISTVTEQPFASGGIVTGPTHALIGEQQSEAVIPLSQLPMIQSARGGTQINVYNYSSSEVTTTSTITPTGTEIHDIVVRELKRTAGNGELEGILRPYMLRRVPTGR